MMIQLEKNEKYTTIKEELPTFFWVRTEFCLLLLSIAIGIFGYKYNNMIIGDTVGLFARSGSIIVLLGAINEYRLRAWRDRQLDYFETETKRNNPDEIRKLLKPTVFLGQKVVSILSHIQVVCGTVIWGFGDLFI